MIFTIEPELRLPAEHVGLRLEGMLLMTTSGYQNLSTDLPIDASAIERMMARAGRGR